MSNFITEERLEEEIRKLLKRINAAGGGGAVCSLKPYTNATAGNHTGDVLWQTIVNVAAGAGSWWCRLSAATYTTGELKITVDGTLLDLSGQAVKDHPIIVSGIYDTSLKIEVRTNNAARTIWYHALWST